jgi:hypothetical protein
MQLKGCPDVKIKVMVRAWHDEPVPLFMYSIDNNRCYVGSGQSDTVIGLPMEQVFLFDQQAFCGLMEAFNTGREDKVKSMYDNLVEKSICNRYQDVLESLHDKENISGSQGVAAGGE